MSPIVIAESARWGDAKQAEPYGKALWQTEIDRVIDTVLPDRSAVVLEQLIDDGLYPRVAAPDFNQFGGEVAAGFMLDITAGINDSQTGEIVFTTDGSDPRLPGGGMAPAALTFDRAGAAGFPIESSTRIKARTFSEDGWSALTDAPFIVGEQPQPGDLVISEFNTEKDESRAFQFIEVQNISDKVLNLSGLRFTAGIGFEFAGSEIVSLDPGAVVVIARSKDGFEGFGPSPLGSRPLAGFFEDGSRLERRGEQIRLENTTAGQVLIDFEYGSQGEWPGISYTLRNPESNPDPGVAASWMTRFPTPGFATNQRFSDWATTEGIDPALPLVDSDGDGIVNLLEYAYLSDPMSAEEPIGPMLTVEPSPDSTTAMLWFVSNASARDLTFGIQRSFDLATWTDVVNPDFISFSNADGTNTSGFTVSTPINEGLVFFRLKVDLLL